jgi:hypothetical protein
VKNLFYFLPYSMALDVERTGYREPAAFPKVQGVRFALACRMLAKPDRHRARAIDLPPATS